MHDTGQPTLDLVTLGVSQNQVADQDVIWPCTLQCFDYLVLARIEDVKVITEGMHSQLLGQIFTIFPK